MPARRRPPLRMWVWTAAVGVVVLAATLLWRGSDAAATTSTTSGPAAPLTGSPATAVTQVWSTAGDPLPGQLVARGRVLVGSATGLQALDPATGRPAWTYTRSNARLCGLAVVDGYAVAVFEVPHERRRCDQAVALDAATGVRMWTRNVNFSPDARLTGVDRSGQVAGSVVGYDATGLVDIDPVGDNIRWRYHAPLGCRISDVTAGTLGVAFVQRCTNGAPQVRLVDGVGGGVRWTKQLPAGAAPQIAGADGAVTVVEGSTLRLLGADDGADTALLTLPAAVSGAAEVAAGDVAVVSAGGAVTAVDQATGTQRWQVPATGAAGPVVGDDGAVVVPEDGALVVRDAATGAERSRSNAAALPAGGAAIALGPQVLLRLPGRVLGYR